MLSFTVFQRGGDGRLGQLDAAYTYGAEARRECTALEQLFVQAAKFTGLYSHASHKLCCRPVATVESK